MELTPQADFKLPNPTFMPTERTVGEVIEMLSKYPKDLKIKGTEGVDTYSLITIKEIYSMGTLDHIMINMWDSADCILQDED
jgi:hypothetical protein